MARVAPLGLFVAVAVLLVVPAATPKPGGPIGFETPSVVDPVHTFGEPTIGVDPQGRVFVSGPTGTGTQRSAWEGSVDGGHSFRVITPGAPPTAIQSIEAPPGGGDTDLNFDRAGHQYFADHWINGAGCLCTLLNLFSNNDICFPATTAHSLRAAVQARLFQGNMLSEPGIRHFLGSGARACVAIRM